MRWQVWTALLVYLWWRFRSPASADGTKRLTRWVDGGFNGAGFAAWVQTQHPKLVVEAVKRPAGVPGFHLLPKRWVIERIFGWLMHCRRLVRDHQQTVASAAGGIYLAMTRLMLRRLT